MRLSLSLSTGCAWWGGGPFIPKGETEGERGTTQTPISLSRSGWVVVSVSLSLSFSISLVKVRVVGWWSLFLYEGMGGLVVAYFSLFGV